ncbi:unnamed protein product [Sphagnum tenellum]
MASKTSAVAAVMVMMAIALIMQCNVAMAADAPSPAPATGSASSYQASLVAGLVKVMMEAVVQREFEVEIREALGEFVSFVCYFIYWRQEYYNGGSDKTGLCCSGSRGEEKLQAALDQEILAAAAAETGKSHTAETFLLPVTFFLSPRFLSLGN